MHASGRFKTIEKLSDSNFHIWKQKIELALVFWDLIHYLEDLAPLSNADEARTWQIDDSKGRADFELSQSDEHLEYGRGMASASET